MMQDAGINRKGFHAIKKKIKQDFTDNNFRSKNISHISATTYLESENYACFLFFFSYEDSTIKIPLFLH